MGLLLQYYTENSNNKIPSNAENLNLIMICSYRNDITGNCILRYTNRISHLAPSNYTKTPPIHYRYASLGDFTILQTFTYTNLDSIAYYTPRLYGIAHCS